MFNFVKTILRHSKFPEVNALDDPVDGRDYRAEEIYPDVAAATPVEWVEKPRSEWRKFPIFNQFSTSSCVAHSVAKLIGIEFQNYVKDTYNTKEYVDVSKRDIYTRRQNKPAPGMWFRDGMEIGSDGVTLETLMPAKTTEAEMNLDLDRMKWKDYLGCVFAGGSYIATPLDIDAIATIVDKGHGVLLGLRFNVAKYDKAVPELPGDSPVNGHHATVVVDRTLWEGKKALVIDDSWGSRGFDGQRVITEDWFNAKLITASWFYEDLGKIWLQQEEPSDVKPKHQFNLDLKQGMRHEDVKKLQGCLDYLGMYELTGIYTGYFGGLTHKAVCEFQKEYANEILHPVGLFQPTGFVGASTRKKLNELFSA